MRFDCRNDMHFTPLIYILYVKLSVGRFDARFFSTRSSNSDKQNMKLKS